jgi:hypothetical protein
MEEQNKAIEVGQQEGAILELEAEHAKKVKSMQLQVTKLKK